MWFAFDGAGFETFDKEEDARKHAHKSLEYHFDNAAEGWGEESLNICWGEIRQHVEITSSRPRTEEDWVESYINTIEERELVDVGDGSHGQLEDLRTEVASVLAMLDELAELWGDEGKFRRCRDRLRAAVKKGGES